MTSEPLTVEELELEARKRLERECGPITESLFLQEDAVCTLMAEFAQQQIKSHSRQLWLEAAPWISVSERLPKIEDGCVIVCFPGEDVAHTARLVKWDVDSPLEWLWDNDITYPLSSVSHWCPLPSRPDAILGRAPEPSSPKEVESSEKGSTPKPSPALPREEK